MGWNGYCHGRKTNTTANVMDKSVFTRNSDAERCRLLMERRPSATTFGMAAKSLSTSTSCATLRAASEPAAMATLQSACLSASVSFTPSPVMAHDVALRLQGHHERLLLLGLHAAEHAVALDGGRDVVIGDERRSVHVVFGTGHAHLRRDARHGARVVARDHLEVDALLLEVANSLRGRRANLIVDGDEPERFRRAHDVAFLVEAVHLREQQHARVGC